MRAVTLFTLAVLTSSVDTAPMEGQSRPDEMRVHFIDVGQADATLLEFACGTVLIDAGAERQPARRDRTAWYDATDDLMEYLNNVYAARPDLEDEIDLLIVTHPHADHTRAIPAVLDEYWVMNVVTNGWLDGGSGIVEQDLAREYAVQHDDVGEYYVVTRSIGTRGLTNEIIDPLACSGMTDPRITVLWGQERENAGWAREDFANANNHSVVVRVDFGQASILFTGDLEEAENSRDEAGIERLVSAHTGTALLDVDVYHAGHHGSHNGGSDDLMTAVSPQLAVISSGPACDRGGFSAWRHGHPRLETIEELERSVSEERTAKEITVWPRYRQPESHQLTKAVYGTGWDGDIVLTAAPDGQWTVAAQGVQACVLP